MNSAPNRDRIIRDHAHCAQCSAYVIRAGGDRVAKVYPKHKRIGNPHHGQVKPRGQHAYRKGLA